MKDILVIGRHASVLERALGMLAKAGFSAEGTLEDADAVERFTQRRHALVVIGGGVEESSRQNLEKSLTRLRHDVRFVEHVAGPQALLNEVSAALGAAKVGT